MCMGSHELLKKRRSLLRTTMDGAVLTVPVALSWSRDEDMIAGIIGASVVL